MFTQRITTSKHSPFSHEWNHFFYITKMKLLSIPLDILKVMEASSKPKFGCKNANDFFVMSFRKCLINEEPTSVTLHLWEFLFYAQFVQFDNLITTEIYDWNEEWVNDNVRFWDWLDHMKSQQCQCDKDKGHNPNNWSDRFNYNHVKLLSNIYTNY